MSPSNGLEETIIYIEEAIRRHECPDSIKADIKILVDYVRESLRSADSPTDETLMEELHRLAAISGMKVSEMTFNQTAYMLGEIIKKRHIKSKSVSKSRKRQRR